MELDKLHIFSIHRGYAEDCHSLITESFDVVDQTTSTFFAARRLPQQTCGIDQISKQNRCRDVSKQPEYNELHT